MSIPIRSMSASRFSTEVNWIRLRSACSRLTCRVRWLAYSSRGWRVAAAWPATISTAFGVSTWQWMSTVNHFPRACAGPGKRPGIAAPGGRHLNSISGFSLRFEHFRLFLARLRGKRRGTAESAADTVANGKNNSQKPGPHRRNPQRSARAVALISLLSLADPGCYLAVLEGLSLRY